MKLLFIIHTDNGAWIFSILYLAAFLLAAGIMIFQGVKRNYPLGSWLLLLFTGVTFFIIGDKVFTYSPDQWLQIFTEFQWPEVHEKNALGGIFGLVTGVFLATTVLGFKRPVFDTLAIALPLALAISRIGCLFAGCCFGIPTASPTGISYDPTAIAYHAQLAQGFIDGQQPFSLPVHPVQIYQFVVCLIIAFLVWKTRHFWKSNGSLFLFSMVCYGLMRFLMEFLVDPLSNTFASPLLWNLNLTQWIIFIAIIPCSIALIYRESKFKLKMPWHPKTRFPALRKIILTALLCIIMVALRHWLSSFELAVMLLFALPVILFLMIEIYRNHTIPGLRWIFPVLFLCSLCFMSQKKDEPSKNNQKVSFTEVGIFGLLENYYEDLNTIVPSSCSDPDYAHHYLTPVGSKKRTFYQGGLHISYNTCVNEHFKYSIGSRVFYGEEKGERLTDYPKTHFYAGISPYATFDWKNAGFGLGFSLGQLKTERLVKENNNVFNDSKYHDGDIVSREYRTATFWPSLSCRFGPVKWLYAEGSLPGLFPSANPYPLFKVGMGSGLGKIDGTKIALGYCNGLYTQVTYPIKNTLVIDAFYADNFSRYEDSKRMLSVGIHYRIFQRKDLTGRHP